MKETRKRTIRKRIRQSLSSSEMKTATTARTTTKKQKKENVNFGRREIIFLSESEENECGGSRSSESSSPER